MRRSSTAVVHAPAEDVGALLLRIGELPSWNPAISSVRTTERVAQVGTPYDVRIRKVISARLTVVSATPTGLHYRLAGPGFEEIGSWSLRAVGRSHTAVTHEFQHGGVLLSLMNGAFEHVAAWRVARLAAVTSWLTAWPG